MRKIGITLAAIALMAGCGQAWRHYNALKDYDPITIDERLDKDGKEIEPFNKLYSGLEEYLKEIYIIKRSDFFSGKERAHSHPAVGIICLPPNYEDSTLFHEAGHLRHKGLDRNGSDFSKKWKDVAAIEYGKVKIIESADTVFTILWADNSDGPKYGCTGPEGGMSLKEDVAEFLGLLDQEGNQQKLLDRLNYISEVAADVESSREFLKKHGKELSVKKIDVKTERKETIKIQVSLNPFYFFDGDADPRYKQKIGLLREYDFISEEQHKFLTGSIGSLRYLLDELKTEKP